MSENNAFEQTGPTEIFAKAINAGTKRLQRSWLESSLSGVIAGMNVAFGAIAAAAVAGAILGSFGPEKSELAHLMGALVFPIGFIFVVVGRSELFTENFLVPTTSVIAREAKVSQLLTLWGLTFFGNLVGAIIVAKMVSIEYYHGVPGLETVKHIQHTAEFLAKSRDIDASFVSAIFAGWLITLMTWLLLSCKDVISKIVIIWCVGFVIMLNQFNHVIVNTAEILMASFTHHPQVDITTWLKQNFLPTLFGNIIGGLVFVTLPQYLKIMRSNKPTK